MGDLLSRKNLLDVRLFVNIAGFCVVRSNVDTWSNRLAEILLFSLTLAYVLEQYFEIFYFSSVFAQLLFRFFFLIRLFLNRAIYLFVIRFQFLISFGYFFVIWFSIYVIHLFLVYFQFLISYSASLFQFNFRSLFIPSSFIRRSISHCYFTCNFRLPIYSLFAFIPRLIIPSSFIYIDPYIPKGKLVFAFFYCRIYSRGKR